LDALLGITLAVSNASSPQLGTQLGGYYPASSILKALEQPKAGRRRPTVEFIPIPYLPPRRRRGKGARAFDDETAADET